jgi:hypothetical protein
MSYRLASLVITGIALATAPQLTTASDFYPSPAVEILVGGSTQRQYPHQGRWYIEALNGREYAIRLRNPCGVRVAVALSVDGLNTIDARQSSAADARKWVLGPYQTIVISGWQTSRTEARRFEFTTEERSYGQALGKTANFGVITAVFFRERVPVLQSLQESTPAAPEASARARSDAAAKGQTDEYAATGMGHRTDHVVVNVWLDLETVPAQTVNIRYEFRPQLVRLGILPFASTTDDRLDRRERARGFEPGFAPVPSSLR